MINSKTKYKFLFLISIIACASNGQQVYFGTGLENAYFKDYVNNLGSDILDLSYSKSEQLFFESGYRLNLYRDKLKWEFGFSYNKYKINTGFWDRGVSVPLTYNLTYFSLKTGFNYSVLNHRQLKIQIHSHISHDWFISGTSRYQNVVNDLYSDNTYDRTLISFHKGISVEYNLSDKTAAYVSYNISDSFREENRDSVNGEVYTFHTNSISFGLIFSILNQRTICYGGF